MTQMEGVFGKLESRKGAGIVISLAVGRALHNIAVGNPIGVAPSELAATILNEIEKLPEKTAAPMRGIRRKFSKRIEREETGFVIRLVEEVLAWGRYRWIGYELLADHAEAFRTLKRSRLEQLGEGIDSWHTVDAFARILSGPAWRNGLISDETIVDWAISPDRWWRRAALVSTVALNMRSHGGAGDPERTLVICELLTDDNDDMVVKAMSWALRVLLVHDPKAVRTFLHEHEEALAARVKREVTNKLDTGLKNP